MFIPIIDLGEHKRIQTKRNESRAIKVYEFD